MEKSNFGRISKRELITYEHTVDVTEKRLITEVYDFAKSIAELQLTESELALFSALVLLQPGKYRARRGFLLTCLPFGSFLNSF